MEQEPPFEIMSKLDLIQVLTNMISSPRGYKLVAQSVDTFGNRAGILDTYPVPKH